MIIFVWFDLFNVFVLTVFKFVERPENNEVQVDLKSKVKFKLMSLKVTAGVDYLPELVSSVMLLIPCIFDVLS